MVKRRKALINQNYEKYMKFYEFAKNYIKRFINLLNFYLFQLLLL